MKFIELGLIDPLLQAIVDKGYEEPSEVQEKSIPLLLNGRDVLAQSQTGTGKTAAFGLPLLNKLETYNGKAVRGLILTPTRELAIQVAQELKDYSKYMPNIKITTVYGGQPIHLQIKDIRDGANIIVATPGRLLDHIKRKTIDLKSCDYLVLDEADEMLNMGFVDDIKEVLTHIDSKSQMTFFSATMPKAILNLSSTFLKNPEIIKLSSKSLAAGRIEQSYYEIEGRQKKDLLIQLLKIHKDNQIMVFANTKRMVDELAEQLRKDKITVLALHGDMKQEQRTIVMRQFKEGSASVLIATDVAARGIDVVDMDMVINYDLPQELEYYVHRIGRTGRAGRYGQAISFVKPRERNQLRVIERKVQSSLKELELPTQEVLDNGVFESLEAFVNKPRKEANKVLQTFLDRISESEMTQEEILEAFIKDYYYSNSSLPISKQKSRPKRDRAPRGSDRGRDRDRGRGRERDRGKVKAKGGNRSTKYETITIPLGTDSKVHKAELIRFVHEKTGLTSRMMGDINISSSESTVQVPKKEVSQAKHSIDGSEFMNKKIKM